MSGGQETPLSTTLQVVSEWSPRGDQPKAIEALTAGFQNPGARQVMLGVTGSGKTFTLAHIAARLNVPTLLIAPNKTLASQLYAELRDLFPHNRVEYFVSYYDYFQPEAYVPSSDTYIEKDARRNEQIDRMRNATTASLLARRDVIVVASVSCIYGLGDPATYQRLALQVASGAQVRREELLRGLVRTQHTRAEVNFRPGTFRVRGPAVEVWPIYEQDRIMRLEMDGDRVEEILSCDPLTGEIHDELSRVEIFPVGHYVQPEEQIELGRKTIREELDDQLLVLRKAGKLLEAERLERRTLADLEDLEELGFCSGIENYSRHFEGRGAGQPPFTLLHYFPKDFLCVLDESHITLSQLYGMVRGDRARKQTLVDYGFRLPSAIDNRPLSGEEFESLLGRVLYVSATPGKRELDLARHCVTELVVRPTGLVDPPIEIRSATGQVENCMAECRSAISAGGRVLVTTLTKRSAEDLTEFLQESSLRARYMHSDIDTMERSELLRDLRLGVFDILVGINLLREGLDLPEVSRVLVLDADREGFLRSTTSLIQTCGRAARNVEGRVILYADRETPSIQETLREANRRRAIQDEYNRQHGIVPQTVKKKVRDALSEHYAQQFGEADTQLEQAWEPEQVEQRIRAAREQMLKAAAELDFENAVKFRDEMRRLEALQLELRADPTQAGTES